MFNGKLLPRSVHLGGSVLPAVGSLLLATTANALPLDSDKWIWIQTPHFTVFSNADEERSRKVAGNIELFRDVLEGDSESRPEPLPTKIFLFKNWHSLSPYARGPTGRVQRRAGMFLRRAGGNFIVINTSARTGPYDVVYHEYTHYSLRKRFSPIPAWLNEGIAEYYSTVRIRDSEILVGLPIRQHIEWLQDNALLSFPELFRATAASSTYNHNDKRGTFYAQSWALYHYLKHKRQADLNRFLTLLAEQAPLDDAFATAFRDSYDQLREELTDYVQGGSFDAMVIQNRDLRTDIAITSRPMKKQEILYELGELLAGVMSQPDRQKSQAGAAALKDAEAHFLAVLEIDPEHGLAHAGLGYVQDIQGAHEAASELYEKAIALAHDEYLPYFRYGYCLFAHDSETRPLSPSRVLTARGLFSRTIQQRPELAEAYALFGATYLGTPGDVSIGIGALRQALSAFPSRTDVALRLFLLQLQNDDRQGAKEVLLRHLPPASDSLHAHDHARTLLLNWDMQKALKLKAMGRLDEMRRTVDEIAKSDSSDAYQVRGTMHFAAGNVDSALADWSRLIEREPGFAGAYRLRAQMRKGAQDYEGAIADYSKLIELDRNDAWPYNALAWLLAMCDREEFRDPQRSVKLARIAVELAPEQAAYWNTLGAAQYRNGAFAASVEALGKAIELNGEAGAFDLLLLAMAHHGLADLTAAREAYERAVEAMPQDHPFLAELRLLQAEAAALLGIRLPDPRPSDGD